MNEPTVLYIIHDKRKGKRSIYGSAVMEVRFIMGILLLPIGI